MLEPGVCSELVDTPNEGHHGQVENEEDFEDYEGVEKKEEL